MNAHYAEQRSMGRWSPVKFPDKPNTETVAGKVRLKRADSLGPEVRAITEIPPYFDHLTLLQLSEVFGPEGKFRAV